LPEKLSNRAIEILGIRASSSMRSRLFGRYLRGYTGKSTSLLDICIESELEGQRRSQKAWQRVLPLLRRQPARYFMRGRAGMQEIPISIAREICLDAASFDSELVYWAERQCVAATQFQGVSKVAHQQKWFVSQ